MIISYTDSEGVIWFQDDSRNRCSVKYFGTEEKAKEALLSLVNCANCVNCSHCSFCSDCSGCSFCSRCSGCSDCSHCSDCSQCSDCDNCSLCFMEKSIKNNPLKIPKIKNIHQKVYQAASQPNALNMKEWHVCNTTHCRAGWVVTLAGEKGKKLERFFNTELAAMLIYRESSVLLVSPAKFYVSNTEALEDMREMAELELSNV